MSGRGRQATKERVREAVEQIVEEATKKVLDDEEGDYPGKIRGMNKTAWTDADLVRVHGLVTFTPEETIPITINGIRYQLIGDIEITVPRIVKIEYDSYRRKMRRPYRPIMTAIGEIKKEGEGGLPPNL